MSTQRVLGQQVSIALVLGIVIGFHLLVPINPDHTFPAVPELVSVTLLSGILCIAFGFERTLQVPDWSFRRSEGGFLGLLWLTVLGITGYRAFLSLFHTPNQVWTPCQSLPGVALKLECFFQASISQNYGYRTFFMLLTAVMLGTLACLIARSVHQGWKLLLGAVVFGPLLVTVIGFFCISFGIEQALPTNLLHNDFGSGRLTQIFGNPGWVWPYFAPGLAIVLWATVVASTWVGRLLCTGISIVLILGILATQQRGGLLLCFAYVVVGGFFCLTRGLKKRSFPMLTISGTMLAVLGSGFYSVFNNQKRLQEFAQSLGYNWKAKPLSVDPERIQIWQAAWKSFKEAPLYGHGYASWFQIISEYGQKYNKPDIVLDTAHNLFVQMLVELGLLHTGLVLSLLILIAFLAFQNSRFLPERRLILVLAAVSFVVPILVQEINYIRPTFYIHAIFWGTLVGLPFYESDRAQQHPPQKYYPLLRQELFSGKARFIPSIGFAFLAGVSLLGILFCSLNFSFGGYPFEANLTQPHTKILRWLGPSVTMASFATAEGKAYSVYDVTPLVKPMSVHLDGEANGLRMKVDREDELLLALENGGRYWSHRQNLSFAPAYPDNTRWITAQVSYPPQQSNLGIGWFRNMYPWETFAGRAGRWCKQNCDFLAKSCGQRDRLDFVVQAPRPDYNEAQPLSFNLAVYGLSKGSEFSAAVLQNLPTPIAQLHEQLQKSGEEKPIHIKGEPETAWYLVHVEAPSVFNPKSQGVSQDNRDLSVVIREGNCLK
jgi:O-antigen ligase